MNQPVSHTWSSSGRSIGSVWGAASRKRGGGTRLRARGVVGTLGLLFIGLVELVVAAILVGINLLAGVAALLLGVLAVPLLLVGTMVVGVLLINGVGWLFQAFGLL